MEKRELLSELDEILSELDAEGAGEACEELAAELEDAIFLLECAEDAEEEEGALEEIAGLAAQLRKLSGGEPPLCWLAGRLEKLSQTE